MRRSMRAVLAVVPVTATALLGFAGPAGAAVDAPITGIWWEPEQSDGMIPAPVDIPEGGLWLQSRNGTDAAVSALKFPVPAGQLVSGLVLRVHSERSLPAPGGLRLCKAAELWFPPTATPGMYASRAVPDCAKGSFPGARSVDGTSISFDLSSLGAPEEVDLVLTGSADATALLDIVFEKPLPADVATSVVAGSGSVPSSTVNPPSSGSGGGAGPGSGSGEGSAGSGFASDPGVALDSGSFDAGTASTGEVPLPVDAGLSAEQPALASGEQPVPPVTGAAPGALPVQRAAGTADNSRTIALFVLAALSLWGASIVSKGMGSRRPGGAPAPPRFTLYSGTPPTS